MDDSLDVGALCCLTYQQRASGIDCPPTPPPIVWNVLRLLHEPHLIFTTTLRPTESDDRKVHPADNRVSECEGLAVLNVYSGKTISRTFVSSWPIQVLGSFPGGRVCAANAKELHFLSENLNGSDQTFSDEMGSRQPFTDGHFSSGAQFLAVQSMSLQGYTMVARCVPHSDPHAEYLSAKKKQKSEYYHPIQLELRDSRGRIDCVVDDFGERGPQTLRSTGRLCYVRDYLAPTDRSRTSRSAIVVELSDECIVSRESRLTSTAFAFLSPYDGQPLRKPLLHRSSFSPELVDLSQQLVLTSSDSPFGLALIRLCNNRGRSIHIIPLDSDAATSSPQPEITLALETIVSTIRLTSIAVSADGGLLAVYRNDGFFQFVDLTRVAEAFTRRKRTGGQWSIEQFYIHEPIHVMDDSAESIRAVFMHPAPNLRFLD